MLGEGKCTLKERQSARGFSIFQWLLRVYPSVQANLTPGARANRDSHKLMVSPQSQPLEEDLTTACTPHPPPQSASPLTHQPHLWQH